MKTFAGHLHRFVKIALVLVVGFGLAGPAVAIGRFDRQHQVSNSAVLAAEVAPRNVLQPASANAAAGSDLELFARALPAQTRREIFEILVGGLLTALGIGVVALSLLRRRAGDHTMIAFGLFALLYGIRTPFLRFVFSLSTPFWHYWNGFVTYLVPIAAYLFFEQILGKGWKHSIRLLVCIQVIFALTAIGFGVASAAPYAAMPANNLLTLAAILVLLPNVFSRGRRPGHELRVLRFGSVVFGAFALHANLAALMAMQILPQFHLGRDWEPVGFLVFIGCLGYIAARRVYVTEKKLLGISQELETARQIQSFILPQPTVDMSDVDITSRYVPMTAVAGDFYDFLVVDENRIGVLVADVSGHGVPAALIGAMIKIAFAAQRPHADDPAKVLSGINGALCGKLESDFVTAAYCFFDTARGTASYGGAGHPPLLLWHRKQGGLTEYRSTAAILGQLESAVYRTRLIALTPGDRIFMLSDGIFEAADPAGKLFGWERLKASIAANSDLRAEELADELLRQITAWSSKDGRPEREDDLTLIIVDYRREAAV